MTSHASGTSRASRNARAISSSVECWVSVTGARPGEEARCARADFDANAPIPGKWFARWPERSADGMAPGTVSQTMSAVDVDASEGGLERETTSNAGLVSNARDKAASRGVACASTSPVDASNATRSDAGAGDADESDAKTSASANAEARDVEARMATSLLAPRCDDVDAFVGTFAAWRAPRASGPVGCCNTCRGAR